jgi:hypothetical protein
MSQIREEIDKMLEGGIIEPAESPWCAPIVPVIKKDGQLRLCVDYRRLNAITRKDSYPLPLIDEILSVLGDCQVYTTLDARSGYWQVPLATEDDRDKTAFAIPGGGHYRFRVMLFGLCNAPSTFQRMMERMFAGYLWRFVIVFIDDIIIYSRSLPEYLQHLRQALDHCQEHGVQLKPSKSPSRQQVHKSYKANLQKILSNQHTTTNQWIEPRLFQPIAVQLLFLPSNPNYHVTQRHSFGNRSQGNRSEAGYRPEPTSDSGSLSAKPKEWNRPRRYHVWPSDDSI